MIRIENTEVYGWEAAIRGMRNPMNSWSLSDSKTAYWDSTDFKVGAKDLALMKKLSSAGNDHAKFLRMIIVTCDIVAPLYWWKEFDTYKIGTVVNSCSTMHKIHEKEFTLDDFSHEHLVNEDYIDALDDIVYLLNRARINYVTQGAKHYWWQMIQLLPSSYNQRRTVQMNYAVLKNMYHARKNHKLDEWREFCTWAEGLPYFREVCADE